MSMCPRVRQLLWLDSRTNVGRTNVGQKKVATSWNTTKDLLPCLYPELKVFYCQETLTKVYTVKLGNNELGYNELPVIMNKSFPLFQYKINYYYNN
jgi:hypothetical protein